MSSNVYQSISLSVASANPHAGDRITITLGKRHGKDVAWSTGEDFSSSSGITLHTSAGNVVPVSRFSINHTMVVFSLAPSDSGAATNFLVDGFLVAVSDIEEFSLTLTTDQGSTVSATLPGRNAVPLSESATTFDWTPQ